MRKIKFLFLLGLFWMVSLGASAYSFSAKNADGVTIYYNITSSTDLTCEVTYSSAYYYTGGSYSGIVNIPANVGYSGKTYSVTSIGDYTFYKCTGLTSVTIPNSVTSIGHGAFEDCKGLTSVTIPNFVTSIGEYAFKGCTSFPVENNLRYADTYLVEAVDKTLSAYTIKTSTKWIGSEAFSDCTNLTSISIPNSVTSIGERAFYKCTGLTSVTIGNSVTTIGYAAFAYCSGLASVTIPNSVTSIANGVFSDCAGLKSITIGNSVTSIEIWAFSGCTGLTAVNIIDLDKWAEIKFGNRTSNPLGYAEKLYLNGELVTAAKLTTATKIGSYAFEDCTSLTSVTIGNSVMNIEDEAFSGCTGLTSVTIPNSVTSIGEYTFSGCSNVVNIYWDSNVTPSCLIKYCKNNIREVTIGNSVKSIGYEAFRECSGLTSVTIGNSVTSIGYEAFYKCSGLTSVTIPNSVTNIDSYAFDGCSSLLEVNLNSDTIVRKTYSNSSNFKNIFGTQVSKYIIGNDVTGIGSYAFYNCSGLASVTIGNSVESIGSYAFQNCTGLTSITIPNSVTSIENGAFRSCSGLTSVTIPNSVTSIGSYAFYGCRGLTSVTIGNSVTTIGYDAFYGCGNAKELIYAEGTKTILSTGLSFITSVTIPNSVTNIGEGAFSGCNGLTAVNIIDLDKWAEIKFGNRTSNPLVYAKKLYLNGELVTDVKLTSATKIENYAFSECTSLTSVTIPNSVTSIGSDAFYECTSLKSVTIGNSVTSIGSYAFYGCKGLTSITIPNSVTSIGSCAFYDCTGLTSVNITDLDKWVEIEFGNGSANPLCYAEILYLDGKLVTEISLTSVTKISGYAFYGCGLSSVTIGNSVTSIGSSAFARCKRLYSVTIGNSVTSIGDYAFSDCEDLSSIEIPVSVTSIGEGAFQYCTWLRSVTMESKTPPTCGSDVFLRASINNATLIVPVGSVITYKKVNVWGKFGTITDGEVQFPTMSVTKKETTQTTISFKLNYNKEKCIPFSATGVKWNGSYYKANSEGIVKMDLEPGKELTVYAYAKYNGEYYVSESSTSASTKSLNSKLSVSDIKANKAYICGVYDIGDAHVYKTTFKVSSTDDDYGIKELEVKNDKYSLTGLVPNTKYEVVYTIYYHYGEGDNKSGFESKTQNLTTADLKMLTLNPRNVSSTSSVVAAEANISDDETGAGFEWRKYDAPESLPSSKGSAIVYDGRMEGKINNLQTTYYNVRPFYKSASGKVFYGEWITFDPSDFSYFEPTVHTYDMIEDPSSNSVEVRGYVMQGTDDVTEQGFEYWTTGSSSLMKMASNGEVMRVQATGQMMIATLKDLEYESNYVVRAYVVTTSGTVYGEERTFTTPADPASGIRGVKESESVSRSLKGIYTLDGRKIERITTPGIYIYNGKKIMFKAGQLPVE